MAPFHQLYSREHPSQPEGFYLINPKHRNSRKWWKCINEWNGGTYLRARWAFVLKRERRWKNVPRLGSGSELCVAAPSVSQWLCSAHCNNCICLWIGYETNLPGKAALTRSSTPTPWVYCNMQSELKFTHLHAHTCSAWVIICCYTEPLRQADISGYETVSRPDCSCLPDLFPPVTPQEGFSESAAAQASPLP